MQTSCVVLLALCAVVAQGALPAKSWTDTLAHTSALATFGSTVTRNCHCTGCHEHYFINDHVAENEDSCSAKCDETSNCQTALFRITDQKCWLYHTHASTIVSNSATPEFVCYHKHTAVPSIAPTRPPTTVPTTRVPTETPTTKPPSPSPSHTPTETPTAGAQYGCAGNSAGEGAIVTDMYKCSWGANDYVYNAGSSCNTGFHVCNGQDVWNSGLSYSTAAAVTGCYSYDSASDCDGCFQTCRGSTSVNGNGGCYDANGPDLAGVGAGCHVKTTGRSECFQGGGLIRSHDGSNKCYASASYGITGVLCCKD